MPKKMALPTTKATATTNLKRLIPLKMVASLSGSGNSGGTHDASQSVHEHAGSPWKNRREKRDFNDI